MKTPWDYRSPFWNDIRKMERSHLEKNKSPPWKVRFLERTLSGFKFITGYLNFFFSVEMFWFFKGNHGGKDFCYWNCCYVILKKLKLWVLNLAFNKCEITVSSNIVNALRLWSESWFFSHTWLNSVLVSVPCLVPVITVCSYDPTLFFTGIRLEWAWITSMKCQGLHQYICYMNHFQEHQSDWEQEEKQWNLYQLFQVVALIIKFNQLGVAALAQVVVWEPWEHHLSLQTADHVCAAPSGGSFLQRWSKVKDRWLRETSNLTFFLVFIN